MSLELIFRDNEKHDEFHRRVVERVKLNAGGGSAECGHDFLEPVGRTVRYGDAESDARAHRFFALFKRRKNRIAICGFNLAKSNEQIDQLDNGSPALRCFHLGDDLLGRK